MKSKKFTKISLGEADELIMQLCMDLLFWEKQLSDDGIKMEIMQVGNHIVREIIRSKLPGMTSLVFNQTPNFWHLQVYDA
jgi:hypothetical protein